MRSYTLSCRDWDHPDPPLFSQSSDNLLPGPQHVNIKRQIGSMEFAFYTVHGSTEGDFFGPTPSSITTGPGLGGLTVSVPADPNAIMVVTLWYRAKGDGGEPRNPPYVTFTAVDFVTGEILTKDPIGGTTPTSAHEDHRVLTDGPSVPAGSDPIVIGLHQHLGFQPEHAFVQCVSINTRQSMGPSFSVSRGHVDDYIVGYKHETKYARVPRSFVAGPVWIAPGTPVEDALGHITREDRLLGPAPGFEGIYEILEILTRTCQMEDDGAKAILYRPLFEALAKSAEDLQKQLIRTSHAAAGV